MKFIRAGLLMMIAAVVTFAVIALCSKAPLRTLQAKTMTPVAAIVTLPSTKPDFHKEIEPIFRSQCQPCHFQGGKVYDKMPFDRPETINRLGTKLFTRIKDEKQKALISEFLNQP